MPAETIADALFVWGNRLEGGVWIAMGTCLAIGARRPAHRRLKLLAALVLATFGVSDFVEACTGAWWRPAWLLGWKAACIAGMAAALGVYTRRRKREHDV